MKKISVFVCFLSFAFAEVNTILPYSGLLDYGDESEKKNGQINGLYFSGGNLSYLFEADYSQTEIAYKKNSNIEDLMQSNLVIAYSFYFEKYTAKGGIHNIDTSDKDLGDGIMIMGGVGRYSYSLSVQKSFGVDGYYTFYEGESSKRSNDNTHVFQITPYFTYSKAFDLYKKNIFSIKANYQFIPKYDEKEHISFELSDTLYYNKSYCSAGFFEGSLNSGVRDGGFTVYNSKDKINSIYSIKAGYYFTPAVDASLKYAVTNMLESGTNEATNNAIVATFSYVFEDI